MGSGLHQVIRGGEKARDNEAEVTGQALHVRVVDGIFVTEHTLAGEDLSGNPVSALFLFMDGTDVQQCPVLATATCRLHEIGLVLNYNPGVPGLVATIGVQRHQQCGPNFAVGGVSFDMPAIGRQCGLKLVTPEPSFDAGDAWFLQLNFSAPVTNVRARLTARFTS